MVEPERLTGVYKNMSRGIVALVFRCDIVGGSLRTGPESTEFYWADASETRSMLAEAYAIRILDAFATTVPVRQHDGVNLI